MPPLIVHRVQAAEITGTGLYPNELDFRTGYLTRVNYLPSDQSPPPLVVYVDVDDTLIRTTGTKRIPISSVIDHVRTLAADGAQLFCWSSGGAEYARSVAAELGIADCFVAFLPKPHVLLDDQAPAEWRRLVNVHPLQCESESVASYRIMISTGNRPTP